MIDPMLKAAVAHLWRKRYYSVLEKTQSGDLDITEWLTWFLECLGRAIDASDVALASVMRKAKL